VHRREWKAVLDRRDEARIRRALWKFYSNYSRTKTTDVRYAEPGYRLIDYAFPSTLRISVWTVSL
jgi:hypothetical protein